MAKVICKLPNASELISGVKFVTHKLGMISEEIADEVAAEFTKIEGYVLAEAKKVEDALAGSKGKKGPKGGVTPTDENKPDGSGDGSDGSDENKSGDPRGSQDTK